LLEIHLFVYLDHAAGYPLDLRVLNEMLPYFTEHYGNPSSFHSEGFKAIKAMDNAREQVAQLINAQPDEIIFTSCATEANNLSILGAVARNYKKGAKIIISSIEHISVINITKELSRQNIEIERCPVSQSGIIDLSELEAIIDDNVIMVSVMAANGEIGSLQPLKEIAEISHKYGALFHSDATAAIGKIQLDVKNLDVDLMTISSNDIYGPKGMGALYLRKGIKVKPHLIGGGQERGLRSGSENIPGIVGMGKAAQIAKTELESERIRLTFLRDKMIKSILGVIPESYLNGHPEKRLPNNVNIRFSYIEGEALIMSLDEVGIKVSSGSACAAKTLEPSHTLLACGLKHEEAHGSLVFTLGKSNNEEHVDYVLQELPSIVKRLRAMSPLTPEELR
jgi:cysteine desulfurase